MCSSGSRNPSLKPGGGGGVLPYQAYAGILAVRRGCAAEQGRFVFSLRLPSMAVLLRVVLSGGAQASGVKLRGNWSDAG